MGASEGRFGDDAWIERGFRGDRTEPGTVVMRVLSGQFAMAWLPRRFVTGMIGDRGGVLAVIEDDAEVIMFPQSILPLQHGIFTNAPTDVLRARIADLNGR